MTLEAVRVGGNASEREAYLKLGEQSQGRQQVERRIIVMLEYGVAQG